MFSVLVIKLYIKPLHFQQTDSTEEPTSCVEKKKNEGMRHFHIANTLSIWLNACLLYFSTQLITLRCRQHNRWLLSAYLSRLVIHHRPENLSLSMNKVVTSLWVRRQKAQESCVKFPVPNSRAFLSTASTVQSRMLRTWRLQQPANIACLLATFPHGLSQNLRPVLREMCRGWEVGQVYKSASKLRARGTWQS